MFSDLPLPIAIVGATGVVGREALAILAQHGVPNESVRAFDSGRRGLHEVPYGKSSIPCSAFAVGSLSGCASAVFCASAEFSMKHARVVAESGVIVVDNSSAWRGDPSVPLVIPEVNPGDLSASDRLVANPNCSTIILLLAIAPIARRVLVRHLTVSTYQAVSGAGAAGIAELLEQSAAHASGDDRVPAYFPEPCAFNVFTHESEVDPETGDNGEEAKILAESRRILGLPKLPMSRTCVRVPVERAHSQSITLELAEAIGTDEVQRLLESAPGVKLYKDRCHSDQPTPLRASGRDQVHIGRVRCDVSNKRVSLWVCGDQLRKGAALNALQVLQVLGEKRRE